MTTLGSMRPESLRGVITRCGTMMLHDGPARFHHRPSRGCRPRAPPEVRPSPILRGLSRPLWAALRLPPGCSRGCYRAALGARAEVWGGVAAGGGRWGALPRGRRQKAVCCSYPRRAAAVAPPGGDGPFRDCGGWRVDGHALVRRRPTDPFCCHRSGSYRVRYDCRRGHEG